MILREKEKSEETERRGESSRNQKIRIPFAARSVPFGGKILSTFPNSSLIFAPTQYTNTPVRLY